MARLCAKYDADYWLERDRDGGMPEAFVRDVAVAGWLGVAMPEEFGGAGLGITEAAIVMQTIAESGAAMSGASAVHMAIFAPNPIVRFGSDELKHGALQRLISGDDRVCFAVTEPNAGLDTTRIETRANRSNNGWIISGHKVWTSTAQTANKMLILARTMPIDRCTKPTDGMSLFYTDLNRDHVEVREIEKMGRKAVDSNSLFIDELPVPGAHLVGEEGKGFSYILHGFNPERILIGAEAVGIGRLALRHATDYAAERVVFGRPIGQNQAIQHPLPRAGPNSKPPISRFSRRQVFTTTGNPCGAAANAAKFLAGEAGFTACERAVMTHGGMGYAKEYHVERFLREILINRLTPVSREMILNYLAERVLGLPRSY